jgi:hypothetical protein
MQANGAQLRELAALYDAGHVRPLIDTTFPFDRTLEALAYVEQAAPTARSSSRSTDTVERRPPPVTAPVAEVDASNRSAMKARRLPGSSVERGIRSARSRPRTMGLPLAGEIARRPRRRAEPAQRTLPARSRDG